MKLGDEIKALTANVNWQSKECYSLAEHAGDLADAKVHAYTEQKVASIRREMERLYKVQAIIIAAGLLDEDKFKEAYNIVTNT